ncbi:hypothetical protein BJF85_04480 [Saccharomonospora sp. CUA-673]|nr:hypothetical protein BJF85_04480 [Saccharomonospora sp. CUA-673]
MSSVDPGRVAVGLAARRDPQMPITDVQWVLGHASLSATQLCTNPLPEDVIASVLAHHERRNTAPTTTVSGRDDGAVSRYRWESLDVLFGRWQA